MTRKRYLDPTERLSKRRIIDPETDCWLWTGRVNNMGYGQTTVGGVAYLTHRLSFELSVGEIPAGLVLDHLCGRRHCMNPEHLEPVTQRENTLRAPSSLGAKNLAKTHCPQGHPYDEANTYVYKRKAPRTCTTRICRACRAEQRRKWAKRKAVAS